MNWQTAELNEALSNATEEFNQVKVSELCHNLIEHLCERENPYPLADAKRILGMLRARRYFDLMQSVGDALIQNGQNAPIICRLYAQSQLDKGNLTAAINTLKILEQETASGGLHSDPNEYAEIRGLLGRAYKDLYLLAGQREHARARDFLEQAISYYHSIYQQDNSNIWHGVNCVALIHRTQAEGIELDQAETRLQQAETMATKILQWVKQKHLDREANAWDFATGLEACIALGKQDDALKWLSHYLHCNYTDAFELGSTYRQLTEVWRLNPETSPGDRILPVLKARLLKKKGGEVEISSKDPDQQKLKALAESEGFEKVFGTDAFESLQWFSNCMVRAKAVAQVKNLNGDAIGTAFVIRGGDINPAWGNELLFMTNAHVICSEPSMKRVLRPEKAVLTFDLATEDNPAEFRVTELWSSIPDILDTTILRPIPPIRNMEYIPIAEELPENNGKNRAYIIGHPQGRRLSFSIHDNHLLDYDEFFLHYRSPTEPGNSGSPVFNKDWELIGLHHRGLDYMQRLHDLEGTYQANEGIQIQAIIRCFD